MESQGLTVMTNYGTWIGNRYKAQGNIMWLAYGDYTPPDSGAIAAYEAMLYAIKASDTNHHLWSAHTFQNFAHTVGNSSWLEVNNLYLYTDSWYRTESPAQRYMNRGYNNSPTRPIFFIEGKYELDSNSKTPDTPNHMRRQAWWGALEGLQGSFYGNNQICASRDGWETNLASPTRLSLTNLVNLMTNHNWWMMHPDSNLVVSAGYGSLNSVEYCPTAFSTNRNVSITYIPDHSSTPTLTVQMTNFSSTPVTCRWFNPTNGAYTTIDSYANTGSRNFTAPNGNDWVLLLEGPVSEGSSTGGTMTVGRSTAGTLITR